MSVSNGEKSTNRKWWCRWQDWIKNIMLVVPQEISMHHIGNEEREIELKSYSIDGIKAGIEACLKF